MTTEDISRILNKYEQGFEIRGYNDTLQELKNMSKKLFRKHKTITQYSALFFKRIRNLTLSLLHQLVVLPMVIIHEFHHGRLPYYNASTAYVKV